MKLLVLNGSPRKQGNTAALLRPFLEECEALGAQTKQIDLYDCHIEPCRGCMTCQDVFDGLGCVCHDDLETVYDAVRETDLIVLATPIYAWYCTVPMKAAMDRLIYAGNKNYGREKGPALLAGKKVACISTCGYPVEKGVDLWEQGVKRWCRHGKIKYIDSLTVRDMGKEIPFMDIKKENEVKTFARAVLQAAEREEV